MPTEGAVERGTLSQIMRTLADIHRNPEAMEHVQQGTTSCMKWGNALGELFKNGQIQEIKVRENPRVFEQIAESLRENKAVIVGVNLGGSDHWFTIAGDKGNGRILHAWQDCHSLRAEKARPIDTLVSLLKELAQLDYKRDAPRLRDVCSELWGKDHRDATANRVGRSQVEFNQIVTGTPNKALNEANVQLARLSAALSEISCGRITFHSATSGRTTEVSHVSARSSQSSQSSEGPRLMPEPTHGAHPSSRASTQSSTSVKSVAGASAGLGFVLRAGGALTEKGNWKEIMDIAGKTAAGVGVEDSVMNSYTFFGWNDVKRTTRPIKSTEDVIRAYTKKLQEKPSKEWAKKCTENLMILLQAMYPEFKELLSLAADLRKAKSNGIEVIGTAMYNGCVADK